MFLEEKAQKAPIFFSVFKIRGVCVSGFLEIFGGRGLEGGSLGLARARAHVWYRRSKKI